MFVNIIFEQIDCNFVVMANIFFAAQQNDR